MIKQLLILTSAYLCCGYAEISHNTDRLTNINLNVDKSYRNISFEYNLRMVWANIIDSSPFIEYIHSPKIFYQIDKFSLGVEHISNGETRKTSKSVNSFIINYKILSFGKNIYPIFRSKHSYRSDYVKLNFDHNPLQIEYTKYITSNNYKINARLFINNNVFAFVHDGYGDTLNSFNKNLTYFGFGIKLD